MSTRPNKPHASSFTITLADKAADPSLLRRLARNSHLCADPSLTEPDVAVAEARTIDQILDQAASALDSGSNS